MTNILVYFGQVVTVPYNKPAGVGRSLPDSLSGRVLREEPRALHADFRARLLGNRHCRKK